MHYYLFRVIINFSHTVVIFSQCIGFYDTPELLISLTDI